MDDARTGGRTLKRSRLVTLGLVLLTVGGIVVGTGLLVRGPQYPAEADPAVRQDVRAAAERFAAGVNTYDVKDLDEYTRRVTPMLTDELATQFAASTQDLLAKFADTGIVATGTADHVAIDTLDADSAVAIASISVSTEPANVQYGQPQLRWRIDLVRQGGRWLVDNFANVTVESATPSTPATPEPTAAPTTGPTTAPTTGEEGE